MEKFSIIDRLIDRRQTLGTTDDKGAGTDHTATEFFTELPEVLLISVNRFTNSIHGRKLTTNVNPSSIISLEADGREEFFYLKSVVQHHGVAMNEGHYTTALNMEGRWLICDDARNFKVSATDPINGYIFMYEKSPLKPPQPDLRQENSSFTASSNFTQSTTKKRTSTCIPNVIKDNAQKKATETCPASKSSQIDDAKISDDSIDTEDLSRDEVIKRLEAAEISRNKNTSHSTEGG